MHKKANLFPYSHLKGLRLGDFTLSNSPTQTFSKIANFDRYRNSMIDLKIFSKSRRGNMVFHKFQIFFIIILLFISFVI